MSTVVRRATYGLGVAASFLLAMGVVNLPSANAALSTQIVKTKYFAGETTIYCPAGWVATGGGVGADLYSSVYVARTEPKQNSSGKPIGWKGNLRQRTNGSAGTGTIYVVCAR